MHTAEDQFLMSYEYNYLHTPVWSGLAQLIAHRTLGRGVPGSILVRGVVCCGLEQVTLVALSKSHFHSSACIYVYVLS